MHCIDSKNDKETNGTTFFFFLNQSHYLVIFESLGLILPSKGVSSKGTRTSPTAPNLVLISSVGQHGCS